MIVNDPHIFHGSFFSKALIGGYGTWVKALRDKEIDKHMFLEISHRNQLMNKSKRQLVGSSPTRPIHPDHTLGEIVKLQ